ncbi:MAG TPA: hypothetical protein VEW46_15545 [Pyrinomonadaceae bacterium]|nr:hypothetical protein [Pyrinomonadaceae bacterium]
MKKVMIVGFVCLALTACQPSGTTQKTAENTNAPTPASKETTAPAQAKLSEATPPVFSSTSAPDASEPIKFPIADFPAVNTTAKAGEYVLAPSYNWIKDAAEKGAESTRFIWYVQKMAQPDKENSEVQFLQERRKIPNAYIVAIPPKETAKVGDVVLTWWQTGSGMQRAIVVDDADPIRPIVRYLDIDYNNPAKSRDGVTTIGKMDERIVPDSFVKLKAWDPGTRVAVQDGANKKPAKVIRVAGNNVLVMETGKLKVYPRSSCQPVPLVPQVKAGDRVLGLRYGITFAGASVSSVDTRNGRIFLRFDGAKEDEAIAFGDVLKT